PAARKIHNDEPIVYTAILVRCRPARHDRGLHPRRVFRHSVDEIKSPARSFINSLCRYLVWLHERIDIEQLIAGPLLEPRHFPFQRIWIEVRGYIDPLAEVGFTEPIQTIL